MDRVIETGEKVQVVIRKNFEDDLVRHFIGEVVAASESAIRLSGYAFVYDDDRSEFERRGDRRIWIVSLIDDGTILTVLPTSIELEEIRYDFSGSGRLVVTDGRGFELDVVEYSSL